MSRRVPVRALLLALLAAAPAQGQPLARWREERANQRALAKFVRETDAQRTVGTIEVAGTGSAGHDGTVALHLRHKTARSPDPGWTTVTVPKGEWVRIGMVRGAHESDVEITSEGPDLTIHRTYHPRAANLFGVARMEILVPLDGGVLQLRTEFLAKAGVPAPPVTIDLAPGVHGAWLQNPTTGKRFFVAIEGRRFENLQTWEHRPLDLGSPVAIDADVERR